MFLMHPDRQLAVVVIVSWFDVIVVCRYRFIFVRQCVIDRSFGFEAV